MKYFLLFLALLTSCVTVRPEPRTKVILVDFQTYTEWGSTKLIPIGRRPIPSQKETCLNPLWMQTAQCQAWIERHMYELQK